MKQNDIIQKFCNGEIDFLQLTYQLSISVQDALEKLERTLPPEASDCLEISDQAKEARQIAFLAAKLLSDRTKE